MRQTNRAILLLTLYALFAAASLWLRSAVPVMAIGDGTHDDFLFVRLAYLLGAGHWLGPYDNLTLAKGMAYPAFILAAFLAGLPLKIAEHLVYLAVSALAAGLVTRMSGRRRVGLILFAVLAFSPILWSDQLARVIREGLYGSLSLALILLATGAALGHHWGWRFLPQRLLLFAAAGLVGGVYWLTREEGVWLVPALAVVLVAVLLDIVAYWRHGARRIAGRLLAGTMIGAAVAALAVAAVVGAVAFANQRAYGLFATNEFHGSAFPAAYGALARIRPDAWRRYVVFPKDAREKAYAVSAAARELKPSLDGEHGQGWMKIGCAHVAVDPCTDIPAAWFMWALRDAAAAAGHHTSARDADAFYRRLAGEINAACDDGRLACLPVRASVVPPFRRHYLADAAALVLARLRVILMASDGAVGAAPSRGPQARVDLMEELVGPVSRPFTPVTTIMGRIRAKDSLPVLSVRGPGATEIRSDLVVRRQDASAGAPGGNVAEFELTSNCPRATCEFVVRHGQAEETIRLASIAPGRSLSTADYDLSIGAVTERGEGTSRPFAREKLRQFQLSVARVIARLYGAAMPVLALIALVGLAAAAMMRRSQPPGIRALGLACAAAVATRVAMLAYLDVTILPGALNPLYLSPATPFFLCFIVLGIYCAVTIGGRMIVRSRKDQPTR